MSMGRKVRVLLADDHTLVREGIRSSLVRYPAISVVGEAANGKEAVSKSKTLAPDILLLDLNMPEMSGMEAMPLIRKQCPNTKIIILTVHDSKEYVSRLLRGGAHGYVLKDTSADELVRAIEAVVQGDAFFSPRVSHILLQDYARSAQTESHNGKETVSEREREVLELIDQGKTTKEIAVQLKLSARTVETYRVRLKRKLDARNVAELLKRARERQLL